MLGYLKSFSRSDAVQNLRSEILKNRRRTKNLNLTLENYHNQVQSSEILLTQCINFYETLKGSREDFNRKYKVSSEKGDSAIQNFTEGIETLKKTELHSCFQTENAQTKHLSDIYYDIAGMQRWMKKCLSDKTLMKSKREKLLEKMKTIKESIRSIKNNQIIPNKKKYIKESESIEKKSSDYKTQIDTTLSTILSLFKEKRQSTINFLKNDISTPSPTSNLRPENFLSHSSDLTLALKAISQINDEIYSYNLYLFDLRMAMEKSVKETISLVTKELDGMQT